MTRRLKEPSNSWERRKYCSSRCGRLGKTLSDSIISKISESRRGKGLGNKNGKGKNLNNKNALGKVSGTRNGNWKGGVSKLAHKEFLAGRNKPKQCEICGSLGDICFDHDHKTGKFRGWICRRCNLVLGLVKDNKQLLLDLKNYLNVFHYQCNQKDNKPQEAIENSAGGDISEQVNLDTLIPDTSSPE